MTESRSLLHSERFLNAKKEMLAAIAAASARVSAIRPAHDSVEAREAYKQALEEFQKDRGRELYYPYLSSGLGSGPFVELIDGSVKYDMIAGIGINFFGHSHPELMDEMIQALPADTMQGNLQPGHEAKALLREVLSQVGPGCRLRHGWNLCSGTMANEFALKIIRQKKAPATRIFAFKDCFAGRSTAMQEITDNPTYRQGQPVYGEVSYLPFYDPALGLEKSIEATVSLMKETVARYPDKYAAVMMELVQGEGGFNAAPREYYVALFEEARRLNLAVWIDEIQTFGRTGELFAFQKFKLQEYVDVVTIGKLLHACLVLYTEEYNWKAGLIGGTFTGSTVAHRTGRRILELLTQGGYLGKEGKIERLSAHFVERMRKAASRFGSASGSGHGHGMISEVRAIGGMLAFQPFSGTMEDVKAVLVRLYDLGVVAFYCGHGPYLIRMLPPFGVMTEKQLDEVCDIIETALQDVARERRK